MAVFSRPSSGRNIRASDYQRYNFPFGNGTWYGLTAVVQRGLNIDISDGWGIANGYILELNAADDINQDTPTGNTRLTLPNNNGTYYIFLRPSFSSGIIQNGTLTFSNTEADLSNNGNIPICSVVVTGGNASNLVDRRNNSITIFHGNNPCATFEDNRASGNDAAFHVRNGRAFGFTETGALPLSGIAGPPLTGVQDYFKPRRAGVIENIRLTAFTAPGGNMEVEVKKNGSTITTLALTNGQTTGSDGTITDSAFVANDVISFDVTTTHADCRGLKVLFDFKYTA